MTRLIAKVCGLTNAADAEFAAQCGAELLGFVHHPPSPRHCQDIAAASRHVVDRAVLVMVADDAASILQRARNLGFGRVQPYLPEHVRSEGVTQLRDAGLFVLLSWPDRAQAPVEADLYVWECDPAQTGVPGGSGQSHAMRFPPSGDFLLAGGLDHENVATRIAQLPSASRTRLRGADAASRLEAAPGIKSPEKVSAFTRILHAL